jgi:hypothetical protein
MTFHFLMPFMNVLDIEIVQSRHIQMEGIENFHQRSFEKKSG